MKPHSEVLGGRPSMYGFGGHNSSPNNIVSRSHHRLVLRSQQKELSQTAAWEVFARYKKGSGITQIEILGWNLTWGGKEGVKVKAGIPENTHSHPFGILSRIRLNEMIFQSRHSFIHSIISFSKHPLRPSRCARHQESRSKPMKVLAPQRRTYVYWYLNREQDGRRAGAAERSVKNTMRLAQ